MSFLYYISSVYISSVYISNFDFIPRSYNEVKQYDKSRLVVLL